MNKFLSKFKIHNLAYYLAFALGLITQILLVRQLTLDVYGEYVIILSALGMSQFIIQSSSQEIYIRRRMTYSHQIDKGGRIDAYTELSVISLCGFIVFLYMQYFITNPDTTKSLIAILCVFSNFRIGSGKSWYLMHYQVAALNYLELLFTLLKLLLTILVVNITHDMYALILNVLISTLIQNAIFHLGINKFKQNEDQVVKKQRIQHGFFYTVSRSSVTQGIFEADIILFANILSPKELAILRIAKTLSQFIVVLIAPMWRNMQPRFIHMQSKKALTDQVIRCHRMSIIVLALVLSMTFVSGESLVRNVYNVEFTEGLTLLLILLVAKYLFFTTNSWYQLWAVTCSNQIVTLLPGLFSIIAMFLFAQSSESLSLSIFGIMYIAIYFLYFCCAIVVFRVS